MELLPHILEGFFHILLSAPVLDPLLSVTFFLAGRWTGGIGIFARVAILVVRMAVHFYNTHPTAHRMKKNSTIDNEFDKLYKEHVSPHNDLKESHETGAKG